MCSKSITIIGSGAFIVSHEMLLATIVWLARSSEHFTCETILHSDNNDVKFSQMRGRLQQNSIDARIGYGEESV